MKIKVLKENKNYLVFEKPAGVVVHGDGKEKSEAKNKKQETIADYILKNYKKIKGVGENLEILQNGKVDIIQKPGIVHRLDKDTSGCLIVAKTQASYENFKKQFQNHKVRKEYVALVWGYVKQETGIIDATIARSRTDFRKKEVVKVKISGIEENFRGEERESLTRYKVNKRIEIFGEKFSLVTFFPETGRMHQIRIHSKSIGHPIVGDHLYGPTNSRTDKFEQNFFKKGTKKFKIRHLLHAKSITFQDPESGEMVKIESPMPSDFDPIFKNI